MRMASSHLLTSTIKCMALLDVLTEYSHSVGVSELASHAGTSRGRAHQLLSTLVACGWVERLEGAKYRLTMKAAVVMRSALEQANIGERIRPLLEELASATAQAVSIAVLDGGEALIVQRAESGHVLRADVGIGTRMPLDGSASGRVLAAFAPPEKIEALRRVGVHIPKEDILVRVRREGIVVSVNEFLGGGFAVAVPVLDESGWLLGALSAAGPTERLDEELITRELRAAALRMGRALHGRPDPESS
jgi:IclR family transcriptional regulator, KDG regulon repressor